MAIFNWIFIFVYFLRNFFCLLSFFNNFIFFSTKFWSSFPLFTQFLTFSSKIFPSSFFETTNTRRNFQFTSIKDNDLRSVNFFPDNVYFRLCFDAPLSCLYFLLIHYVMTFYKNFKKKKLIFDNFRASKPSQTSIRWPCESRNRTSVHTVSRLLPTTAISHSTCESIWGLNRLDHANIVGKRYWKIFVVL